MIDSDSVFKNMVKVYRKLHRSPELSFEEVETAKIIISELERIGIKYTYGGKGRGIIGYLGSGPNGIAIRAEMDGLPGNEATGLAYSSKNKGVMHACGHDAHMAMVLASAELLSLDPPPGRVVFIFQPAEERGSGSKIMIEDGALKGIKAIYAGHVWQSHYTGHILISDGIVTSQSDRFIINIKGKAGHGARPHESIDAVVVTGLLITSLQVLVSRESDPVHPTVITIGKVVAGIAANVIAGEATLEGSIRTTLPLSRKKIHSGIKRISKAIASLFNADIDISFTSGNPPVVNTKKESEIAKKAALKIISKENLLEINHPSLGSEDFSFYLKQAPGCYVRFGARKCESDYVPLHSPAFYIDEDVLKIGAQFFNQVVREGIK